MSGHYALARLRQGVLHFLVGKVGSALLTFCGFLLVARLLPPADYGRYVSFIALVELGLNVASLGLDWVSTRYVPAFRVKAGGRALVRLIGRLVALQTLALVVVAVLLAAGADLLTGVLGVGAVAAPLRLYAAYLLVEGLSRVLRDQMLAQLLLQGRAQAALLLRHLLWVGLCLALWWAGRHATLITVAWIELAAASLGLLVAAVGLGRAMRRAQDDAETAHADWVPPTLVDMRRLAWNSYLALWLNLPARPQVVTLLVTRLAGVEAAALYGFARSLSDQVLRFLPAELLLGFVRPVLVARYVERRDFGSLNRQVSTLLVVSLLVLAPVLALAVGRGDLLVQVLGAGRFDGSAVLLAWMLAAAALFSHRRLLEFVANTVDRPQVIGQASLLLLLVPAMVFGVLAAGWPMWTVPASAWVFEALFGVVATRRLQQSGVPYAPPLAALGRVSLAVALAAVLAAALPLPLPPMVALLAQGALVVLAVGLTGLLLPPLDAQALGLLKSMFNKRGTPP